MKLSVIIPCYNAEKYIGNCIYKILNEQIDNVNLKSDEIEIIVINDGSTDNSQKIIEDIAFKHTNVKLINKINEGVSTARNIGIKNAMGQWIAFIDADDFLDKGALPKLIEISQTTESDVIAFQYRQVSPSFNSAPINNKFDISKVMDGLSYMNKTHGCTWRTGVWSYIYKKEFLMTHKIRFAKDICFFEDAIFILNVFSKAKTMQIVNNIFYNYVQTSGSCMHNYTREHLIKINNCTMPLIRELDLLHNTERPEINIFFNRWKNSFILGNIHRTIKHSLGVKYLSNNISLFTKSGLYPIVDFTDGPGFNHLSYKVYRILFNNKITLYLLYFCYKLINVLK